MRRSFRSMLIAVSTISVVRTASSLCTSAAINVSAATCWSGICCACLCWGKKLRGLLVFPNLLLQSFLPYITTYNCYPPGPFGRKLFSNISDFIQIRIVNPTLTYFLLELFYFKLGAMVL